jgi:DNA repair exonuclease SbcCD ATPase subunit
MSEMEIKTGDDLAAEALATTSQTVKDELAASDQIAETLASLQTVIERNANEMSTLEKQLKEKREMLKNTMDNDQELAQAEAEVKKQSEAAKKRKADLSNQPQAVSLKLEIAELAQNKKEIEEALSNHLVNYHQLTGSTSFDTSDGDQWEFNIKARVKTRK